MGILRRIRAAFVALVYADHNRSRTVKTQVSALLEKHCENGKVLNVGSGSTRIHPQVINLDIEDGPNVDFVGSADSLPFESECFDLIITQEAFEHIEQPQIALKECYRVLKQGGAIYFQVPFIIGYHPGPTDFVRFTSEGVYQYLQNAGFQVSRVDIAVGGATGFYRIAVEFSAILFSGPVSFLYTPAKGLFALLFYPIKWLDFWFSLSPQRDRIAGGYMAVGTKA